ncbi:hypothetical protein T492DRAFT_916596 [Pavlovales sp. CCMP2436]|nr:hypothetical protein T492DRAFT_916596 [Pavlovales sp. CCMP2436]
MSCPYAFGLQQFPAQLPHNAVSLLMEEGAPHNALEWTLGDYGLPPVEQQMEEGAPPNALEWTLGDYGLPPVEKQKGRVRGLKTKVPSSEAAESAAYLF